MTIADQITRLNNAKAAIKSSLENKGVTVSDTALLDEYAALIDSIEAGGGEGGDPYYEELFNMITNNNTDFSYLFYNSDKASLDLSNFDTSNATNMTVMFDYCYALTTLNPPRNISASLSFKKDENLNYSSLKSIVNNLKEVKTAKTLTLSSTSLNLLTIEDIAIASQKGWTVNWAHTIF